MKLRRLKPEDAPLMLEWMHDVDVVHDLKANFAEKTIEDCLLFISNSQETKQNLHLAITDDNDVYMGTVSLKHIGNGTAEFGITVRRYAMGKGYSAFGMKSIINYGFEELNLDTIYWCVNPENKRAIHFYDKHQYKKSNAPSFAQGYSEDEKKCFVWYFITK